MNCSGDKPPKKKDWAEHWNAKPKSFLSAWQQTDWLNLLSNKSQMGSTCVCEGKQLRFAMWYKHLIVNLNENFQHFFAPQPKQHESTCTLNQQMTDLSRFSRHFYLQPKNEKPKQIIIWMSQEQYWNEKKRDKLEPICLIRIKNTLKYLISYAMHKQKNQFKSWKLYSVLNKSVKCLFFWWHCRIHKAYRMD